MPFRAYVPTVLVLGLGSLLVICLTYVLKNECVDRHNYDSELPVQTPATAGVANGGENQELEREPSLQFDLRPLYDVN